MEWGAVTYLSRSKYGKNEEIWINPSSSCITGCAGTGPSVSSSSGCSYHYTTSNGQQASTTGSVYGIYDMSGGAYEYVMGGMYNSDNKTIALCESGFSQETIDGAGMEKNIDKYTYGTSSSDYSRRQLGDATGETREWYSDESGFVISEGPWGGSWFERGAGCYFSSSAGAFFSSYNDGNSYYDYGFRLVIS